MPHCSGRSRQHAKVRLWGPCGATLRDPRMISQPANMHPRLTLQNKLSLSNPDAPTSCPTMCSSAIAAAGGGWMPLLPPRGPCGARQQGRAGK
eukprot:366228-Chlamydomonas_euryale.AAC.12